MENNTLHMDGLGSFARAHNDAVARERQRLFDILNPGHNDQAKAHAKHIARVKRWAAKASEYDLREVAHKYANYWTTEARAELERRGESITA